MQHNIEGRPLAILAGALFALGTLGILLEDVILHAAPFTLKHAITVIVVAGTIMVGHQVHKAWHSALKGSAIGFGVLFLVGTLLTVYSSVGRQAEHTMVASAEVEAADKARTRATKGLTEAETMLADSQRDLARECKTGKGKRCEGIAATVAVYTAAAKGYAAELDKLGPVKIATPEAKRAGELAAVFGGNPTKVEAAMILLIPFLTTIFLELGAIICLGYGFRPVRRVTANDNAQTSYPVTEPLPPARQTPPMDEVLTVLKGENVVDWTQRFAAARGRWPNIPEGEKAFCAEIAAKAFSRSTLIRRMKEAGAVFGDEVAKAA
jgi:hypothetical protein